MGGSRSSPYWMRRLLKPEEGTDTRHERFPKSDVYPSKIPGAVTQHRARQFYRLCRRLPGHPYIDPQCARRTRYQESLRPPAQEESCRSSVAALARMAVGADGGFLVMEAVRY